MVTARSKHAGRKIGGAELEIDPCAPRISEAIDRDGKIYRKTSEVRAECVLAATPVETVLADGTKETKNIAAPGDYIVTAPAGERYAVKRDTFLARYTPKPGSKDVYNAHGHVIAIPNPFGCPVSIVAPWGEKQHGSADCMIADIFDPAAKQREGRPYLIAGAEFRKAYRAVRSRKRRPLA